MPESVEDQLKAAVDAVINSTAIKKIIVAGPGAGKTWLFRKLLENCAGNSDERLILTFINSLKNDLAKDLGDLAQVYTFHGYCRRLLHQKGFFESWTHGRLSLFSVSCISNKGRLGAGQGS